MSRILDRKNFKYTPSHETDIRKTFARIKAKQKEQAKAKVVGIGTVPRKVKA